jgi:hypothetical protein
MRRFVEGTDRGQSTLFPECLEDWIDENNPVRVINAFVEQLELSGLGFDEVAPEATGRPSYHPSGLLKLYIYGYRHSTRSALLHSPVRCISQNLTCSLAITAAIKDAMQSTSSAVLMPN